MTTPLESFWSLLVTGALPDLLVPGATWDDPLFDGAKGDGVREVAIPRFAKWYAERGVTNDAARHFRTTDDGARVVVEHVVRVRDGMIWNQAEHRAAKAPEIELATAVVGERDDAKFRAVRVYFSTWAVLEGASRVRIGPIAPDEGARAALEGMPVVKDYFERLAKGDPSMVELFEADGYFREPANNYACGGDQLREHFQRILEIGGVGIELLTSIREEQRLGLELQTVKWGPKTMSAPQAGFAIYELGPHGLLQGARVYDSVVPPTFG